MEWIEFAHSLPLWIRVIICVLFSIFMLLPEISGRTGMTKLKGDGNVNIQNVNGNIFSAPGSHFYGNVQVTSPKEDISLRQLSPEQQSLLREIWRYQKEKELNKVVIMYDAFIFDDAKKERTTTNLYSKALKKYRSDAYRYEAQFEEVINSIPMVFLKHISETRYDNPYVVTITEEAKRLLD